MPRSQEAIKKELNELFRLPQNRECADCNARGPRWAVVNHGIWVCLKCSGIHRDMGTHISTVKSGTIDDWSETELARMKSTNNERQNRIYLAKAPPDMKKPDVNDDRYRQKYINEKYRLRKWYSEDSAAAPAQSPTATGAIPQPPVPVQATGIPGQFAQVSAPPAQNSFYQMAPSQSSPYSQPVSTGWGVTTPAPQQTGFTGWGTTTNQARPAASVVAPRPQPQNSSFGGSFNPSGPRVQQVMPVTTPPQSTVPSLLDFGTPAKPAPKPVVDPNAAQTLLSCFNSSAPSFSMSVPNGRTTTGSGW